jgi:hypothetical protein
MSGVRVGIELRVLVYEWGRGRYRGKGGGR